MKKFPPAIFLITLLAVAVTCPAQESAAPAHRVVPTVTRTIQIFSNLENAWNDSVKSRDSDSLKKILSERYELRTAASPGRPTPRDESIALAFKDPIYSSAIEQMAVFSGISTLARRVHWQPGYLSSIHGSWSTAPGKHRHGTPLLRTARRRQYPVSMHSSRRSTRRYSIDYYICQH